MSSSVHIEQDNLSENNLSTGGASTDEASLDHGAMVSPPHSPRSPNSKSFNPPSSTPGNESNRKSFRLTKSPMSRSTTSNRSSTSSGETKTLRKKFLSKKDSSLATLKDSVQPSIFTIPSSALWIGNNSKSSSSMMRASVSLGNGDHSIDLDEFSLTSSVLSLRFSFEMLRNKNALLKGGMGRHFSIPTSKNGSTRKECEKIPLSVGCFVLDSNGKLIDVITVEQAKSLISVENILNLQGLKNRRKNQDMAIDPSSSGNLDDSASLSLTPQSPNSNIDKIPRLSKSKKSNKANSLLNECQTPLVSLECQLNSLMSETEQRKSFGVRYVKSNSSTTSATTSASGKTTIGGYNLRTNTEKSSKKGPEEVSLNLEAIENSSSRQLNQQSAEEYEILDDYVHESLKQSFNIQVRDWKTHDRANYESSGISNDISEEYANNFYSHLNNFTMSSSTKGLDTPEQREDFNFCQKTVKKVMFSKYDTEKSKQIGQYLSENPFGEYSKLIFFLEGDLNSLEGDLQVTFENNMLFTKNDFNEENVYQTSSSKFLHQFNIEINQPSVMDKTNTITTLFSLSYDKMRKEYGVDLADPLSTSSSNYSTLHCHPFPLPHDSYLFHLPKVMEEQDSLGSLVVRENQSILIETKDPKNQTMRSSISLDSGKLRLRISEENRALGIRPIRTNHYCILMDDHGGVVDIVSCDKRYSTHAISGQPTVINHLAHAIVGNNNAYNSTFDYFDLSMENLKHVHEVYFVSMIGDGYEHSEIPRMGLNNTAMNNISSYLFFDSTLGLSFVDKANDEKLLKDFPVLPHPSNCIVWCKLFHSKGETFVMKFLGEHLVVEKKPKQSIFSTIVKHIRHHHHERLSEPLCNSAVVKKGNEVLTYDFPVRFSSTVPIMLQFQGASHPHLSKPSDIHVKLSVYTFDKEAYFLKKQHIELRREGPVLDGVIYPIAIIPKLVEKASAVFCVVSYREFINRDEGRKVSFDDSAIDSTVSPVSPISPRANSDNGKYRNIIVIDPLTRNPLFSLPLKDYATIAGNNNGYSKEMVDFEGFRHLLAFKMERKKEDDWEFSYVGEWMPIDTQNSSLTKRDESWVYHLSDLYLVGDSNYKRSTNERLSHAPIPIPSQYMCIGVRLEDTVKKLPFRSESSPLTSGTTKKAQKTKNIIDHTILKMKAICYNWRGDAMQVLSSSNSMPTSGSVEKYLADDSSKFAAIIDRSVSNVSSVQWPMQGEYDEAQCYMMLDSMDDTKMVALSPTASRLSFRRNKDFLLPETISIPYFSILLKLYIVVDSKEITVEDVIELLSQLNAVVKVYNMETKNESFRFTIQASQIPYKAGENPSKINSHLFLCSIKSIFDNNNSGKSWQVNPILQRKQMGGELTKYLASVPKVIKVQILEAKNLPVMDQISGLCDGFVLVYNIENSKGLTAKKLKKTYKTKTIKKNLNPKWVNETFNLNVPSEVIQRYGLLFVVKDRDMLTTEVIGYIFIPYSAIENGTKSYKIKKEIVPSPESLHQEEEYLGEVSIRFELLGVKSEQPLQLLKSTLKKFNNNINL